jgi:hypothetical protein
MSALESSVTLEDVFSVVEGKRVPLAPELAGYLTLEVADGTEASGGAVDARTVYISEEGTVALVRPKKDGPSGDAETSVRAILAKLLDASGSATPALTASARRKPGAGLPALVSELEAALIPVNRAAGRRALARLAREVKRVTLGVGRNASMPPVTKAPARPSPVVQSAEDVMAGPDAPPGPRASFTDEAQTAERTNQLLDLVAQMNGPDVVLPPSSKVEKKPLVPSVGLTPPPIPGALAPPAPAAASPAPPAAAAPPALAAPAPPLGPPPPARPVPARPGPGLPPPPARPGVGPPPRGKPPVVAPPGVPERKVDKLFEGDEVDSLLSTFEVSNIGERQMRTDLKAIAGLDPTPGPPDARTLADLTKDVGKALPKRDRDGDSVEALLALADTSGPLAPPLPPPGFSVRLDDAPMIPPASVAQPGSPFAAAGPALPQTPSPLVPMNPSPMPGGTGHAPLTGLAVAHAVDPGLRRPQTPPRPARTPAPPAPPAPSSRRDKGSAPRVARSKTTGTNFRQPRAPRTGLAMLVLTLFVLVAGGIAVWMFKPAFFTGKKRPVASATVSASAVPPPVVRCKVALVVSDVPPNAEILLRMGPAPLDVERMPVGTRLEFVGTAEGFIPRRAVIKAESTWEKTTDGKPRIDVPIQLDPTKAKPGAVDPWPVAEPGSQVGGSGSPGTVHVVSNVRGAEVWLLAGLGPEARIEQLRCDGDIDILLAGPPQLRKRLHVSEKDIQAATADPQGNRVVSVSGK